jgi:type IV pilus assembly protein PilW
MKSLKQRGFTLLELMIAVFIALFLIGGLLTLVQAMKSTSLNQNGLSQLQDSERMAMSLMTDVIQSTGYFPLPPLTNTAAASFPVVAPFTSAGQALFGTGAYTNVTPGGTTITVRYQTNGTGSANPDNVINCTGGTSAVAATFVNTFSVDASRNLVCALTVNGVASPAVPLIPGVQSMQIYYGVQTNTAVGTNSIDAYLDAATVTAGNAGVSYWPQVKSVKITLTFVNPLFGQQGQPNQFVTFTRIVDVMNKTGVTT